MQLIRSLKNIPKGSPIILTIGNFDGVHLGHREILKRVVSLAKQHHTKSCVLTFSNHPRSVLHLGSSPKPIDPEDKKLDLLEECGIDMIVQLPFTKEFSEQTPEIFLKNVLEALPFSHLILGLNSLFGKDRQGTPKVIQSLAQKMHFSVEYLPPFTIDGITVSSSAIRKLLLDGNYELAAKYLGRNHFN